MTVVPAAGIPVAPLPDVPMSLRARIYLWTTAVMNGVVGLFCAVNAPVLRGPSYGVIHAVLPWPWWSALFLTVTALSIVGAISGREAASRLALIGAACSAATWAAGFGVAYFEGRLAGPTGVIVWGAIAVKDLIVCRQPLRSPFEPLTRVIAGRAKEA